MTKLVLLRHGESTWNRENRFTGWTDVPLTEKGEEQATQAGKLLSSEGYSFDLAYTSVLKRAIDTLQLTLKTMNLEIPIKKSWRLNERHYGALQGEIKPEMAKKVGEEQVLLWRRSYDVRPPALDLNDSRHPQFDSKYKNLPSKDLPSTECLKDTINRLLPYWKEEITPQIKQGKRVIITAHGNSLRAIIAHLERLNSKKIIQVNVPIAIPLVYELDQNLEPIQSYYLGDQEKTQKAIQEIIDKGKASSAKKTA